MSKTPHHIGIIMDGNRRWAKEKGLPAFKGHEEGLKTVEKITLACKERGVKVLTIFAFSTENWKRSKIEVNFLMNLIKNAVNSSFKRLGDQGIKIKIIGQKERLPKPVQAALVKIEGLTKNNQALLLNIALSYGGRAELTQALKNIIQKKIPLDKINEEVISKNLWTSDVDLVIRTGKEQRISNFLIWQSAYSELYFSPKYWPDFTHNDLENVLTDYSSRQRRFGK
jgi:undecaprenyl diphosphate synthase